MKIGYHTVVLHEEEVTITVQPVEVALMGDNGLLAGVITHDLSVNPHTTNTIIGDFAEKKAKYNIKSFKRTGYFGLADIRPKSVDHVSPKIDGEPMYIRVTEGKGVGYDRKGSKYNVSITGDYERKGRRHRSFKLLTEWVPRIEPGAKVYLTHAWQFGVPNMLGFEFSSKLLENKQVVVVWPEAVYRLDHGPPRLRGSRMSLALPRFGARCDGLVLHQGVIQRYIKPYRTIDIKEPDTYEAVKNATGAIFDYEKPGSVCEYAYIPGEVPRFKYIKTRRDKQYENAFANIMDLITAPDFDTWFDELESLMEDGELEEPEGWHDFARAMDLRDPEVPMVYEKKCQQYP